MSAVLAWLTENRRRWLYAIVVAVVPLLAAANIIAADDTSLWLGLAQAVLGLGAGVLAAVNAEARWRAWLYSMAAAVSAVLIVLNVLPSEQAPLILAVIQAVLTPTVGVVAYNNVPDGEDTAPQLEDGGHS